MFILEPYIGLEKARKAHSLSRMRGCVLFMIFIAFCNNYDLQMLKMIFMLQKAKVLSKKQMCFFIPSCRGWRPDLEYVFEIKFYEGMMHYFNGQRFALK